MIKKDSSKKIICLTCSDRAIEGSEYCEACIKAGREKLGLEIPDMFEELDTLREGVDNAAEIMGAKHGQ
jgi:hypothetical protein